MQNIYELGFPLIRWSLILFAENTYTYYFD